MGKGKSILYKKYYDKAIQLYREEGMGSCKLSKVLPVSEPTLSIWIRNFVAEHPEESLVMRRLKKRENAISQAKKPENAKESVQSSSSSQPQSTEELQAEIARLKEDLRVASLRADIFNEMINVAEKQFNIPIRKKTK